MFALYCLKELEPIRISVPLTKQSSSIILSTEKGLKDSDFCSELRRDKCGNTASNRKCLANIELKETLNLPLQIYIALLEIHFVKVWDGTNKLLPKVLEENN